MHSPLKFLPPRRALIQSRRQGRLQETSQLPRMLSLLNKETGLGLIRRQLQRAART